MSKLALCPACGKTVYFQGANNLAGCGCHKVWYRDGDALIEVDVHQIHGASDVIQPATTGSWNGINFFVTGRLRLWFGGTAFNYWTFDCSDGIVRYLAEGYGMYAVYEELSYKPATISRKFQSKSKEVGLPDDRSFWVTKRNEVTAVEIEGNVYTPVFPRKLKLIDAISDSGRIELISFDDDLAYVYAGHDVAQEMLTLSNLREKALNGRKFSCGHCFTENFVSTYPYAQSWVCGGCSTRYSVENFDGHLKDHGGDLVGKQHFHFDPGEIVSLEGTDYRVVGCAYKQDFKTRADYWKEYALFHPVQGFGFVTEASGHWTFLKETQKAPLPVSARNHVIDFEEKIFRRFSRYQYRIIYAVGEFPGDIFSGHREKLAMDYVNPPEMLSFEKDYKGNVAWFRGKYVPRKMMQEQARVTLPKSVGIGASQPPIVGIDTKTIAKAGLIAFLLLLLVQIITTGFQSQRTILDSTYSFADSLNSQTFVTERFELEKQSSNIGLHLWAPVDNSWLELNATLVNATNGTEYTLVEGVEYYAGYDGDGSWSEGSKEEDVYFTKIPAGTYFLQLAASREPLIYRQVSVFSVKAVYNGTMYRNVWLIGLMVLGAALLLGLGRLYTEQQRWVGSPFSGFLDS